MAEGPPISYESWAKAIEQMNRYREALERVRHIASYHTNEDEQIAAIFEVAHEVLTSTHSDAPITTDSADHSDSNADVTGRPACDNEGDD